MQTPPDNPSLPRPEGHADLIAAAREQIRQTPVGDDDSGEISLFDSGQAEFQNYELVRELHRGGQGVVYLAVQRGTRREVAIKMVREGPFATVSEKVRFQREIEILGTLKHPHIVTIHDSGTVSGISFYVMDYVAGLPLDDHVRMHRPPEDGTRSRAECRRFVHDMLPLFAKICDAVHVAHLRGVIHRDLKPSNVRVDTEGEPRVLDFGLAKDTLSPDGATAAAGLTQTGQFLGTLAYASPEQAGGACDNLDMRTDVYSLGVMLYEMITGRLPYAVDGALPDVLQNIRQVEPTRPSSHIELRGDLDTILLKCLSKPKERRYQTAGELAADLRRYIDGKPIEAKRDSAIYLLRMFARRHRVAALVIAAFIAVLGVSSATLAYMYANQVQLRLLAEANEKRATENEALASRREAETRRAGEFQAARLADVDPELMGARLRKAILQNAEKTATAAGVDEEMVTQRSAELLTALAGVNFTSLARRTLEENIFDRTILAIDAQFAEQPLMRARLLQTLADTMVKLGLFEGATAPQEAALEIRRRESGDHDLDTLESIHGMGTLHYRKGHYDEAQRLLQEALDLGRSLQGPDHLDTLSTLSALGQVHQSSGRWEKAESIAREVLSLRRSVLGDEHPMTLQSKRTMCNSLRAMGRLEDAMPYCLDALEGSRRVLGDDHPDALLSINNLAVLFRAMDKNDEAYQLFLEALETRRRILGDEHPETLSSISNLGSQLYQIGRYDESLRYSREALQGYRRVLGDEHPDTLTAINNMGIQLSSMGKLEEATPFLLESLELRQRVLGDSHPDTIESTSSLAYHLHLIGKTEESLVHYERALATARQVLDSDHPSAIRSLNGIGSLLRSMGRLEEAKPYLLEALEATRRSFGETHRSTIEATLNVGRLLAKSNDLVEAEVYYRQAIDGCREVLGNDHPNTLIAIGSMGSLYYQLERYDEALELFREVLATRRRVLGDTHPNTLISVNNLAVLLRMLGRYDETEALLLEAAEASESLPDTHRMRYSAADNLVTLYEVLHEKSPDSGYDKKAEAWRARVVESESP